MPTFLLSDILVYMKPKILFSLAIVFVAAVVVYFVVTNNKNTSSGSLPVNNMPTGQALNSIIEPEMISVDQNSYLLGISGSYPKFSQADESFNKKISDTVMADISVFKENANDNYQARLQTGGDEFQKQFADSGQFTYQVTTEVIQSNNQYVSVLIRAGGFSGGAHGYENIFTFNYDVKNKKEITLADLFSNDKNYLKTISGVAQKQLVTKLTTASEQTVLDENMMSMLRDGTDPSKPENFLLFTISDDRVVTIYFSQYQVAPYVYGEQAVEIKL